MTRRGGFLPARHDAPLRISSGSQSRSVEKEVELGGGVAGDQTEQPCPLRAYITEVTAPSSPSGLGLGQNLQLDPAVNYISRVFGLAGFTMCRSPSARA